MCVAKPIEQLNSITGTVVRDYPSIRAAGKALRVHKEGIREVLGSTKTIKGFKWRVKLPDKPKHAKILILDIETAPLEAYVWQMWKQNIYPNQLISNWYILTWAAKWLYEDEVYSDRLTSNEALLEDDGRIMKKLWQFMTEADIIVCHNGDKFDIPRIKTRFLFHDMVPPSFYKQIDTLKIAKKEFDFPHNSLNEIASFLNVVQKIETSMQLWADCKRGNNEALVEMEEYNKQDVRVLEDVYLALRPYVKGHPNLDLYIDSDRPHCPHCGTNRIKIVEGKYVFTQAVRYRMYRCSNCFAIAREKKGTPYNNKKQISAIPR